MNIRIALAVTLLPILAACTPTGSIESRPFVGVGTEVAPVDTAAALMRAVCTSSNPFAAAAANDFIRDSTNNIMFHQRYDLSIQSDDQCTLVFGTTASFQPVQTALIDVPAVVLDARSNTNPAAPGRTYYGAIYLDAS